MPNTSNRIVTAGSQLMSYLFGAAQRHDGNLDIAMTHVKKMAKHEGGHLDAVTTRTMNKLLQGAKKEIGLGVQRITQREFDTYVNHARDEALACAKTTGNPWTLSPTERRGLSTDAEAVVQFAKQNKGKGTFQLVIKDA